ncbi:hypothetical protein, partial [Prevotella sp.]|uniref:hypothetical protein n=1 Tax=Prevotella sp. TaxID=59823 RepID=UPI002648C3C9
YCIYLQYLLKQMHIPADFFLYMHKRHLSPADSRRQKTDWANDSANADNAEKDKYKISFVFAQRTRLLPDLAY